jgi:tetratricopeptide (TPR) repeat protein
MSRSDRGGRCTAPDFPSTPSHATLTLTGARVWPVLSPVKVRCAVKKTETPGFFDRLFGRQKEPASETPPPAELPQLPDAAAYFTRGLAHAERGDLEAAIADFSKAIDLDPKAAAAYNNRGTAYADKGNFSAALADFFRAIELNPKNAAAYYLRGLVHARVAPGNRVV